MLCIFCSIRFSLIVYSVVLLSPDDLLIDLFDQSCTYDLVILPFSLYLSLVFFALSSLTSIYFPSLFILSYVNLFHNSLYFVLLTDLYKPSSLATHPFTAWIRLLVFIILIIVKCFGLLITLVCCAFQTLRITEADLLSAINSFSCSVITNSCYSNSSLFNPIVFAI